MKKRTFLSIVFAVMFAIVTLLAAGNAAAQGECDPPLSCTTDNGWTVELMEGAPVPVVGGYKWSYLIKKLDCEECDEPLNGLLNLDFSIPVCCPDPVTIGDADPILQIKWPPGTPGSWGFGQGILQSYAIRYKISNSPQEIVVWFIANSNNIAKGTVALVADDEAGLQTCEIAVPGCPTFALAAVVEESSVSTTDGRKFRQVLNPYTQCPEEIYERIPCEECDGGFYERKLERRPSSEVLQATHGEYDPEGVVFLGNPGDDCGGAIVKSDSDNSWFFCFLGWCYF